MELPIATGDPTGPRGGTHRDRGSNIPIAVPPIPRHSRWVVLMHVSALSEPTLLWAAKGVLCPHEGGTETHRAHTIWVRHGLKIAFYKRKY